MKTRQELQAALEQHLAQAHMIRGYLQALDDFEAAAREPDEAPAGEHVNGRQ